MKWCSKVGSEGEVGSGRSWAVTKMGDRQTRIFDPGNEQPDTPVELNSPCLCDFHAVSTISNTPTKKNRTLPIVLVSN